MKRYIFIFLLTIDFSYLYPKQNIIVGAERIDLYQEIISNKSIGLLVNHTSIVKDKHIIDTLLSLGNKIEKIYSPEHGFTGKIERGKLVSQDTLSVNNIKIPIISMYGKNRIPSDDDLKD